MTLEKLMDYLQNLPPLMQFILLFITFAGTSGLFAGLFAVWKLYAQADASKQEAESKAKLEKELTELRMRLEPLELERLRQQNEAKQIEATNNNMKNLIDVIAATNDRWQKVVDAISERKHDDETRLIAVLDKLDGSIDRNSQSVDELAGGLAGQLGNVAKQISVLSDDNKQTEAYIRSTIETTNRNIDSVLEAHVAIRDRVIPMIDNLEKRLDKLDNCADMLAVLEQIKAILSKPTGTTQPIPEIVEPPALPENTEDNTDDKKIA